MAYISDSKYSLFLQVFVFKTLTDQLQTVISSSWTTYPTRLVPIAAVQHCNDSKQPLGCQITDTAVSLSLPQCPKKDSPLAVLQMSLLIKETDIPRLHSSVSVRDTLRMVAVSSTVLHKICLSICCPEYTAILPDRVQEEHRSTYRWKEETEKTLMIHSPASSLSSFFSIPITIGLQHYSIFHFEPFLLTN